MRQDRQTAPLSPEEEYDKAAATAVKMLARRPLSEQALAQKLMEKEFSPESADYAVERMKLIGALDDMAYAEMVIRSFRNKGCGKLRIRQELAQRGVPRELAEQALEEFEPDWDAMVKLLDKRLHGDVSDRKQNDKAFAMLQRKGFSFGQIKQAMELYCESLDET